MNWLCWHVGTVNDPKFGRIADVCRTSRANVIAIWALILEGARDGRGAYSLVPGDVSYALGIEEQTVIDIHEAMTERGLVDGNSVIKWAERQGQSNAERAREWRERRKGTPNETEQTDVRERSPNHTDRQTDRQTKKEKREARATRLPADWLPSADSVEWFRANRPDLNLAAVAESFLNHWHAEGGQRARKVNWDLAFREWAKRERARPPSQAAPQKPRFIQPG